MGGWGAAGKEGALTACSPPLPLPRLWVYTVLPLGLRGERGCGRWEPRQRVCSRAEQERAVVPTYKESTSRLQPATT